tara:strand:- start:536 stop:766 length:231 start_codon:yes stop_codon:yes gene_type:complete
MNASEWIKKINEAQTDEEIMNLWTELTNQSPRTSSGGWDHAADDVTRDVHRAVGMKVALAVSRTCREENTPNTPEV